MGVAVGNGVRVALGVFDGASAVCVAANLRCTSNSTAVAVASTVAVGRVVGVRVAVGRGVGVRVGGSVDVAVADGINVALAVATGASAGVSAGAGVAASLGVGVSVGVTGSAASADCPEVASAAGVVAGGTVGVMAEGVGRSATGAPGRLLDWAKSSQPIPIARSTPSAPTSQLSWRFPAMP